jgi:hypothetical protein
LVILLITASRYKYKRCVFFLPFKFFFSDKLGKFRQDLLFLVISLPFLREAESPDFLYCFRFSFGFFLRLCIILSDIMYTLLLTTLISIFNIVYFWLYFQGQTLVIPSGWIHATYTRNDSIYLDSSMLHDLNIGTQVAIQVSNFHFHRVDDILMLFFYFSLFFFFFPSSFITKY